MNGAVPSTKKSILERKIAEGPFIKSTEVSMANKIIPKIINEMLKKMFIIWLFLDEFNFSSHFKFN